MKIHFIHIPKNGGMTIRHSQHLRGRITVSAPDAHVNSKYTQQLHATMKKYNQHLGNEHARWRDLNPQIQNGKAFAIVRNPWSRTVSRYTFMIASLKTPQGKRSNTKKSFEEYLEERHVWGGKEFFWHRAVKGWFPQKNYVTDEDGNLRCDILRLEHLNEDIIKYFGLEQPLNVRNVSNGKKVQNETGVKRRKDYKEFYTEETKQIITDWYKEDIEFFGFTFDGPATRNIWNK